MKTITKRMFFPLLIFFFFSGCASRIHQIREVEIKTLSLPEWYDKTLEKRGEFIYAVGNSEPKPTEQEAKDEALARATEEVVKYSGVTVESFAQSIDASSIVNGNEYWTSDFERKSRIRALAFVRMATPVDWYVRRVERYKGKKELPTFFRASVYLKVPEKEIERIQDEKDIKLSLDIGIYFENEQGQLQYITEGTVLHSGDAYALYIRSTDDCYLYIYQVDDLGRSYRLFPNDEYNTGANPARAGEDYWIPNTEQYFMLDEITGKERLYLFASSERIVELEGSSELEQANFDRVLKTMGVAGLKEKLNTYLVKPPKKKIHVADIKKKLQAEGAFVYETWFWHR